MKRQEEVGRFLRWGAQVSIDMTRKLMTILPESQPEKLVEIPNGDIPSDEALDIRVHSY